MACQQLSRQQNVCAENPSTGRWSSALLTAPAFALMLLISACSTGNQAATNTVDTEAGEIAQQTASNPKSSTTETTTKSPTAETTQTADPDAETQQAAPLASPGCSATSAADGVNVTWWGLPSDSEIDILGDGQVLIQTAGQAEGVLTLFGAPSEPGNPIKLKARTTDDTTTLDCGTAGTLINLPVPDCALELVGGKPQLMISYKDGSAGPLGRTIIRDGEPVEANYGGGQNPIDTSATPGSTYEYQIEVSDSTEREPAIGDCGSITIPKTGDEATALTAARDLFTKTAFGPHAYFTIVSLGDTQDLYMQADATGGRSFVPSLDNSELMDPFTIHTELSEAIAAGKDVAYQLDESSGLPTWWTVDDRTVKLTCFELDTAPPELRLGPCDPESDFIGR